MSTSSFMSVLSSLDLQGVAFALALLLILDFILLVRAFKMAAA